MTNAADVVRAAAIIYAAETLSLHVDGDGNPLGPEAYVPVAVRLCQEVNRAEGMGWAEYLAAHTLAGDGLTDPVKRIREVFGMSGELPPPDA